MTRSSPKSAPTPAQAANNHSEGRHLHTEALRQQLVLRLRQRRFRQDMLLFVLLLIFGIVVMNHIQTVRANEPTNDLSKLYAQRAAELTQAEAQYNKLLTENEDLLQQKEAAVADLLNQEGYESLQNELTKVRALAGFTAVSGSGITLTLNDKVDYDILNDPIDSIVHDSDVRHAWSLLTNSGAAALAVNGQRIVNSSYVFCIGPTILCNMQRLTPPYVITAVGDPRALAEAIRQDPAFNLRQSSGIDLVVQVKEETDLVVPAFAEADSFEKYIDRLEVVKP